MRINALFLLHLGIFIKLTVLFTPVCGQQGFDYGKAQTQNELINIDYLHDRGYTGKGVTIAIFDAGFKGMQTQPFFNRLFSNGQIIETKDYWEDSSYVYHKSDHGTMVASYIAVKESGEFVGTAPDANLLLTITDDIDTETHQDEQNWISAIKWADSLGADIISSSLTYYDFDPGDKDYTYEDLDGETTPIANAADKAARKGMLVVNAAGNGGHTYTPCNADSVLCVGGTDSTKSYYEYFASNGPTYDGRIKPDVATQILNVWGITSEGLSSIHLGGTSSSTPMISGLAACLMEAHPNKSHLEIMKAIEESGHQSDNPDTLLGHGVPNARIADSILSNSTGRKEKQASIDLKSFPNPFSNQLIIQRGNDASKVSAVTLYSSIGKSLRRSNGFNKRIRWNVNDLKEGVYFLRITIKNQGIFTRKLIKK